MKIFITGVAGFLGSHLADRMLELGYQVTGNDNMLGGDIDNVDPRVIFYNTDCCNQLDMSKIIAGSDVVIHTAATAHEGLSMFSPAFISRNIYQASVSTISASVACGVKRFVYCSSMARYGNQVTPFTEDFHNTSPVDPYGIAKVAGEQVLKVLANTHGMEWNIAVPHNIVGPRQRYDDPFRNVISIMINRNLQGKPSIIYGDGTQQRCFSYIDDCITCLEQLALGTIINETVNIGPDEGTITINQLAQMVANECNVTVNPIYVNSRPGEVKLAMCSADKARRLFDYKTSTNLETAIKSTVEWIKLKGTKPFDYSFPLEIINDLTPTTWKDRLM